MDAILSIPMSDSVAKERLVWAENKKGRFTVSSAYKLGWEIEAVDRNASYSDLTEMHGIWRRVWSMNMPNKIKNFAWKACNGISATKDSFSKKEHDQQYL